MVVKELIEFLQKQPQDLVVIYKLHSEMCVLEEKDIEIGEACIERPDGWVQSKRKDKETKTYLIFPGN